MRPAIRSRVRGARILVLALAASGATTALVAGDQGAPAFHVFHVATALADGSDTTEQAGPEYYISAGIDDGVREGMLLDVHRSVTLRDPHDSSEYSMEVGFGTIRVIRAYPDSAIARSETIEPPGSAPLLRPRSVMIGDRVRLPLDPVPAHTTVPVPISSHDDTQRAAKVALPSGVLFDRDSAELTAAGERALRAAFSTLATAPEGNLVVEGHTCDLGSDAYNRDLSDRRARTVAGFLVSHGFVSAGLVSVVGRGESEPVAGNTDEKNRRLNRRVEFHFLEPLSAGVHEAGAAPSADAMGPS